MAVGHGAQTRSMAVAAARSVDACTPALKSAVSFTTQHNLLSTVHMISSDPSSTRRQSSLSNTHDHQPTPSSPSTPHARPPPHSFTSRRHHV
eukprot:2181607-Rhodomonas_salina.1